MTENEVLLSGKNMKFIPYNTGFPQMPLPEYGRNIQNMVDYCVEIPDRDERTACAYGIISVMKQLFPQNVGDKGDLKPLWDHLNIMARFELDIDFPVEVITAENMNPKPEKIPYTTDNMKSRQYGRSLEGMIKIISDMEPNEERDELIRMCAHQMKKMLLMHNPEGVSNERILNDLRAYSDGKIDLDSQNYQLLDFQDITPQSKKSKKKKKNILY